jgi:hypothetical protein
MWTNGYDASYAAITGSNGTSGLSGMAPTRRERARSMEHEQIGVRTVALEEDSGARGGVAGAVLQHYGAAESGSEIGIQFIEPPCT